MSVWRVILTATNRPFAVMNLEPGSGLIEPEPPDALLTHVQALFGEFDRASLSADEFGTLAYRDLQWPPPQP